MTPQQVAKALGGVANGRTVLAPGPDHSPSDRSMSVTIDPSCPNGFVVNSFAGDDFKACRDYVKDRLGIGGGDYVPKPRRTHPRLVNPDPDKRAAALAIWNESKPIEGTIADTYLGSRRVGMISYPEDLRFHPGLWNDGEVVPAMVALMRDVRTNAPTGVHRTFLRPDGTKLGRKMLGTAGGACVKLSEDASVTHGLGIAEGIETALSIVSAGFRPIWACLSAGAIAKFPVLPGIEEITVFADRDENGVGERAAAECCRNWILAGREAKALSPVQVGDFNDWTGT